jgi:Na+-translocating ferredoxin:NAD+ oxidoreductase RnfG subunit
VTIDKRNIAIGILAAGVIILLVVVFTGHKNEALPVLQEQQKQLNEIAKQQEKTAHDDRVRDSLLYDAYTKNSSTRERQLQTTKQHANETINHINASAFNGDSIRRAFANN